MFVKYLAEELVRCGHEVHVFFNPGAYRLVRGGFPAGSSESTISGVNIHSHKSKHERAEPLVSLTTGISGHALEGFERIVRSVKPDVVHWHNTKGFVAVPVKIRNEVLIHTTHDYHSICPRSNLVRPEMDICENPRFCQLCLLRWKKPLQLWRIGNSRVLKFPDTLTVISPSRFVADRLGKDNVRVDRLLRNFVPDQLDSRAKQSKKRNLLLFLGMLESHKGPRRLIEAFHLCKNLQEFQIAIVGRGPIEHSLRKDVQDLRLENRVQLLGFIPRSEVTALLREAAALVIPSEWHENAPLVALEAFSMATPVLGSSFGGLPEILTPDAGSMVFRGKDTKDLSGKIMSLWERRDELESFGKMAREAYEKSYSPSAHIPAYIDIVNHANGCK